MFRQLVFVRLKAAEKALKDGRLDEAYRLATTSDLREHRRARAVLEKLAGQFLDRARMHYRADRCEEALRDLDKAAAAGLKLEEIAELRAQVLAVAAELRRKEQSRYRRLQTAAKRAEQGSLQAGRRILEEASEQDHAARELREHFGRRAKDAMDAIEQAQQHIKNGQWAAAAERIKRAKSLDKNNKRLAQIEDQLCDLVVDAALQAIMEGRLSRASNELACLADLGERLPAKRELSDLLTVAQKAGDALAAHNYTEARRHVMALSRLLPKAKWVREATDQLKRLEDLRTNLCAGPLGERMDSTVKEKRIPAQVPSLDDTVALPDRPTPTAGLVDRLLLLVDGGGSYLILRSDQAAIGRVVATNPAEVPIFSDLGERHACINRAGEDYFLVSEKEVAIAGRKTRHHLLRNGERVVLGRKAKFTFRIPSRKSTTAILELSDTTKMPNDVRRVVLFKHHATVGSGPTSHILCRHASPPLVLFERDGALWIRQKNDGHVDAAAQKLNIGEPVEIGGASLVLEPWRVRNLGSTQA
jgi:tetratricopeptide (TPR) repeat protein